MNSKTIKSKQKELKRLLILLILVIIFPPVYAKPTVPIDIDLSVSNITQDTISLFLEVKSKMDFMNVSIDVELPQKFRVFDGEISWDGNLTKDITIELNPLIQVSNGSNLKIKAIVGTKEHSFSFEKYRYIYLNVSEEGIIIQNESEKDKQRQDSVSTFKKKEPFEKYTSRLENILSDKRTQKAYYKIPKKISISDISLKSTDYEPKDNLTVFTNKDLSIQSGGQITVRGYLYYTDDNDQIKPIRYATVYIYDAEVGLDSILDTVSTDENGYFQSDFINNDDGTGQGTLDVYLKAVALNSGVNVVDDEVIGNTYSVITETMDNVPDGVVDFGDNFVNNDEPWWVFDTIISGWLYFSDVLSYTHGRVKVVWPTIVLGTSASGYDIYIEEGDEMDEDVILHEYGHSINYGIYGNNSIPATNCDSHGPGIPSSQTCAMAEGWANYVSSAVQNDRSYIDTNTNPLIFFDMDYPFQGEDDEGAIGGILWDIDDVNADGADRLTLDIDEIFDVMDNYQSSGHNAYNIHEFYTGWFNCPLCNPQNHNYLKEVNSIFCEHGIKKDTTTPPTPAPTAPSGCTADTTPTITGYAVNDAQSGVKKYQYRVGPSGAWQDVGQFGNETSFSPSLSASTTVYVKAIDYCGNEAIGSVYVCIDTSSGSFTLAASKNNLQVGETVTVSADARSPVNVGAAAVVLTFPSSGVTIGNPAKTGFFSSGRSKDFSSGVSYTYDNIYSTGNGGKSGKISIPVTFQSAGLYTIASSAIKLKDESDSFIGNPNNDDISINVIDCDVDDDGYSSTEAQCGGNDCNDNSNSVHPGASETCNNRDDDCDGNIDESISRQCGTTNIGRCEYGLQYCSAGQWGSCAGNIEPQAETCNNLDDDCNGNTDNGYSSENCQYVCAAGDYTWTNNGGIRNCCGNDANEDSPYQSTETSCSDGRDNDCDGTIDQSDTNCYLCTSGQQRNCANQNGVCLGSQETCTTNQWPNCGVAQYNYSGNYETAELSCDNKDNDCDGTIDEEFSVEACRYVCQKSGYNWTGNGGNLNCCGNGAQEGGPFQSIEMQCADGRDNDCDGAIDILDTNCRTGILQPYFLVPITTRDVKKNTLFNFTAGVVCLLGTCGDINVTLDPVGPDGYGYTAKNSSEPDADPYLWEEIVTNGIGTPLWNETYADDQYQTVPLGFSVPFYENNYTTVYISSNGRIHFTTEGTTLTSVTLPSESVQVIAPLNRDMLVTSQTKVFYKNLENPRRFVIEYYNLDHYGTYAGNYLTFEVILYETGKIKIQYNPSSGVYFPLRDIGINFQNSTNKYLLLENSAPNALKGAALTFYPPFTSSAKGVIPQYAGSPFYTIDENPRTCTALTENKTCVVTWRVNATGPPDTNYTFFALFSPIMYRGIIPEIATTETTIKIIANAPPAIGTQECRVQGDLWKNCSEILYDDIITKVRVSCSDIDGNITLAHINMTNEDDTKLMISTPLSFENGWWVYDNLDVTVRDSGNWTSAASCRDSDGGWTHQQESFFIPFGTLQPYLINPKTNTPVAKDSFFTFSSGVQCTGGECGNVEAVLDPMITLYDAKKFDYDIYDGCYIFDGESDTFDSGMVLSINNNPYTGVRYTTEDNGREAVCANQTAGLIGVSRKVYVDNQSEDWARYLEILENPTNALQCVNVKITSDMGSDGSEYRFTSDNDTLWETTDDWLLNDDTTSLDCTGDTVATFMYQQNQSQHTLKVTEVNPWGGYNSWTWNNVCIAPHAKIILMHYLAQTACRDGGIAEADAIRRSFPNSTFLGGLSADELQAITNWDITAQATKGIIPMNQGVPFYTVSQNPAMCPNMSAGDICTQTWRVNATGGINRSYDFFTIYSPLEYRAIQPNETTKIEIMISGTVPLQGNESGVFILRNNTTAVAWFGANGNLFLNGNIFANANSELAGVSENIFEVKNNGTALFWVTAKGDVYAAGDIIQEATLNPADIETDDFVIKDNSGNKMAVITESGDMFLKGVLSKNK